MMRFFAAVALIAVADALTLAPTNICRTSLTARRTEAIVAQFGRKPPPPPPPPPKKGLFSFGGSKTPEDVKASKPAKTVAKKATLSPAPPKPVAKKEAAEKWCQRASDYNATNGGKRWEYVLIAHDKIAQNMTIEGLVNLKS